MPGDPPSEALLDGIVSAVDRDPGNDDLRAHLSWLLLAANRSQDALDEATLVLVTSPDDRVALRVAAVACRRHGDDARAKSFERLADAFTPPPATFDGSLGRTQAATGQTPPPSGPMSSFNRRGGHRRGDQIPDSADDLMNLWGDLDPPRGLDDGD